jgi:Ca2+-binding RTX toxin-like protein
MISHTLNEQEVGEDCCIMSGAQIVAFDALGTGLDMSGFTNGFGTYDLTGSFKATVPVDPDDYESFRLEGSGPYYTDGWTDGPGDSNWTLVTWRDAGSNIFVAHLFCYAQDGIPTVGFLDIDTVVERKFLNGAPVSLSFLKGDDIVTGNKYADILKGGDGKDRIEGNAGNDRLFGERGNDTLHGDGGSDTLIGGTGRDALVFDASGFKRGVDRITDFNVADDTIHLDNLAFTGLSNGMLGAVAFARNASGNARDASDRVIYETDTGKLFYDADGKGGAAKVHFATLNAGLNLTSADFFVV